MYFTVYKITNKINGKEYIGSHKTSNLSDNYMGSGKHLKHSQKKYGLENFSKEIIFRAVSSEAMYFIERMLVDEEYVARDDTYNLKLGGSGGFDYINNNKDDNYYETRRNAGNSILSLDALKRGQKTQKYLIENNPLWLENRSRLCSESLKSFFANGGIGGFNGKTHTEETKRIMSKKAKIHSKGKSNSQFGSMWIYNLELKENKKIPKGDLIPDGWLKGRKMKF